MRHLFLLLAFFLATPAQAAPDLKTLIDQANTMMAQLKTQLENEAAQANGAGGVAGIAGQLKEIAGTMLSPSYYLNNPSGVSNEVILTQLGNLLGGLETRLADGNLTPDEIRDWSAAANQFLQLYFAAPVANP